MTVSAIIPAYNAARWIARAIDSVLSQTHPVQEIIVVDDGSTDMTPEVVAGFGELVRYIQQSNGGPAKARNTGIRAASGEWVALLDADDAWLPGKIERQLAAVAPDVVLIHGGAVGIRRGNTERNTFAEMWKRNPILNSSVLVRKDVVDSLGGFDEDPAVIGVEEYNLWLRIAHQGMTILNLDEDLVEYTPTVQSLTAQVPRFVRAELSNAAKIAALCNLSRSQLRFKELQIVDAYGREFVHLRMMKEARALFSRGVALGGPISYLMWLGIACVPATVLDWRRSLLGRQVTT